MQRCIFLLPYKMYRLIYSFSCLLSSLTMSFSSRIRPAILVSLFCAYSITILVFFSDSNRVTKSRLTRLKLCSFT